MSFRRIRCTQCRHLKAAAVSEVPPCALGRAVLTLSRPNFCARYEPLPVPEPPAVNASQLALFGALQTPEIMR